MQLTSRIVLLTVFAIPAAAGAQEADSFRADIEALTRVVKTRWSYVDHRESRGVDLAALEREALDIVAKEPTKTGFLRALRRYAAGLHDGHAFARLDGVSLREPRRWPFGLVEVREGIMVDGVHKSVDAGKLRWGDLVLAIDGEPIEGRIEAAAKHVYASTEGARRSNAIFTMPRGTRSETVRVRVRRQGAKDPVDVELACIAQTEWVRSRSWKANKRRWFMIDGHTAYFRPATFSWPRGTQWFGKSPREREEILDATYREFGRIIDELKSAKAMILDLRGNPGGTDLLGQALACHLVKPSPVYFKLQARMKNGEWHDPISYRAKRGARGPRYLGKIVCLIDEGVFSTADNFAVCLRDTHPDIQFVGRATGAGTGAPRPFTLEKTGAAVTFCTQRVYGPKGGLIEGIGVEPDVAVTWTRADHLLGRDPDLETALRLLAYPRK